MKWKSQSLFDNAAEKSIIIIKFDVDSNTALILIIIIIIYIKSIKNHDTNQMLV